MVRKLLTLDLCDDCDLNGIPEVPAVTQHIIAADGGPPRRVLLCPRCELLWAPFLAVYEQRGQAIDLPAPGPAVKKAPARRKPRAAKAAKPKELEAAPKAPAEEAAEEASGQLPLDSPSPQVPDAKKQYLRCPEYHKSTDGPKDVTYSSRNTHAGTLHGLHVWEIAWEDPTNILVAHCTEHELCRKNKLGFTSETGLKQHIVSMQADHKTPEGDPQKSDGPSTV